MSKANKITCISDISLVDEERLFTELTAEQAEYITGGFFALLARALGIGIKTAVRAGAKTGRAVTKGGKKLGTAVKENPLTTTLIAGDATREIVR